MADDETLPVRHERRKRSAVSGNASDMLIRLPASLLFERLPVPLLLIDKRGVVAMANQAMAALTGSTPAELLGQEIATLIPETESTDPGPVAVLAALSGEVVRLRTAEGYVVHARVSPSVLMRSSDTFAFVAFEDVTERLWST